jgi:hypothetical protein
VVNLPLAEVENLFSRRGKYGPFSVALPNLQNEYRPSIYCFCKAIIPHNLSIEQNANLDDNGLAGHCPQNRMWEFPEQPAQG